MGMGSWVEVIKTIKTPIGLIVLLTLITGSILNKSDSELVQVGTLALLFLITVTILTYTIKNNSLFPKDIKGTWNKDDLPLTKEGSEAWQGKWNCRWTHQTKDKQFKPYVDDILEITDVDTDTGELTGFGHSSYTEGAKYSLRGRVSDKGVAHIFYSSAKANEGLSGIVILTRPPIGNITGWWVGAGRHREDSGGSVIMEKHSKDTRFKLQNYDVD